MMALKKQDNIKCAFLKEVHQASNNNFNLLCLSQFSFVKIQEWDSLNLL